MTEEEFKRFLNWLDPDLEKAAVEYKKRQRRLIAYFRKWQCSNAEDLADEVIDRAAKQLLKDPTKVSLAYIFGIARNVCLQHLNKGSKTNGDVDWSSFPAYDQSEESSYKERIARCLRRCLQSRKAKDRRMFVLYYAKCTNTKNEARIRLTEESGLSINALRLKMMRMREALHECISNCLQNTSA